MAENVTLTVRGKNYEGWKQVTITRSIKAVAASFSLSLTDNWSGADKPWILIPGDSCEIKSNGDTVLKGYVEDVETSYDARQRTITVSGRERTGDLVDCSVDYAEKAELTNISLTELAKKLSAPVGVKVKNESGATRKLEKVSINPGDTIFSVLDRSARQVGLLLTSDGKGTLVIQKVGQSTAAAQLIEGENILAASSSFSMKNRFKEYRVISQSGLEGLDEIQGFQPIGKAFDSEVSRSRLLVVTAEQSNAPELCQTRAKWESVHRKGESVKVSAKVQGWRLKDGSIFEPNRLYKIKSPWIGVDQELLLEDLTLTISMSGTVADLKFTRKDAYRPEYTPKKNEVDLLKKLIRENSIA